MGFVCVFWVLWIWGGLRVVVCFRKYSVFDDLIYVCLRLVDCCMITFEDCVLVGCFGIFCVSCG